MTYLLISNLALLLFFLIYRYGLRKFTFFSLNRWYLLSSVLIAYLFPLLLFVEFQVPEVVQVTLPLLDLTTKEISGTAESPVMYGSSTNWMEVIYWLGVGVTLAWFGFRIFKITSRKYSKQEQGNYSFLGKIHLDVKREDSSLIQAHEEIHVKQRHSFDLIFIELFRAFNWFNPVFIWIRDELKFQHECIVDAHFDDNKVAYAELLLAYAMNVHPSRLSHEFSNKSLLKERIKMIFKHRSNSKNKVFYLSILPLAILLVGLIVNCKSPEKEKAASDNMVSESTSPQDSADANQAASAENDKQISKEDIPDPVVTYPDNIVYDFDKIEVYPAYPGGIEKFRREVAENLVYPKEALDAEVVGKIELSFVIDKQGNLTDIQVIKDLGYGTGEAAIKSLKSTKKWSAGIINGKTVNARYTLPIQMDLRNQ